MTRHKKFLKAEKARTKLKSAKLPKGLNVTKTEFKTRRIVIPDQLRDRGVDEVLSKNRLNLRDCLTRLGHNNLGHRMEGVRGLRDIIDENFDVVNTGQHMANILGAVAALAIDMERDVRRESFRILALLMGKAGQTQIEPFFDVLCSYLRCAMTHIQPAVHEDSLLFLDVLIAYLPGLVATHHGKILGSFVDMISKLRSDGQPQRTLKVRLAGKLTSSKWRTRVLEKLFGLFMAVIRAKRGSQTANIQQVRMIQELTIEEMFSVEKPEDRYLEVNYFNEEKRYYYSILHDAPDQKLPDYSHLVGLNLVKASSNSNVQETIESLVPLLFESWMEIRPQVTTTEPMTLSTEAAQILKQVLQIFLQFLTLIELTATEESNDELIEWFKDTYAEDFAEYILPGFPFTQMGFVRTKNADHRVFEQAGGTKCTFQNLSICKIYFFLTADQANPHPKMLDFIVNSVQHWTDMRENSNLMFNLLDFMLLETKFCNSPKTKEVLKALIRLYLNEKTKIETKAKILILLCKVIMDQETCETFGHDLFANWIRTLPELLTKPTIPIHVVQVLILLSRQMNKPFLNSLTENITGILENLAGAQVIGAPNEFEGQKLIGGLVFWVKHRKLHECLSVAEKLPQDLRDFVVEIIQERMKK